MLTFIKDRLGDYNTSFFINDLAEASKQLGILEATVCSYKFNSILIPFKEDFKWVN